MNFVKLLALSSAIVFSAPASAAVIYANGSPAGNVGGYGGYVLNDAFLTSVSFTLTQQVTVAAATAQLDERGIIDWSIGTSAFSANKGAGSFNGSLSYTPGIAGGIATFAVGQLLGPGTYWLTLMSESNGWIINPTGQGSSVVTRRYVASGYEFQDRYSPYFSLLDTFTPAQVAVPEPGTLAVFGLGLFGLLAMRRKKVS